MTQNRAQEKAWERMQELYRAYCLRSIHESPVQRQIALKEIEKAVNNASCYIPVDHVYLKW